MNLLGAGGAVFCPAGADEDARAADFAAAEFFQAENGLFQLRLLGQYGAAKPAAKPAEKAVAKPAPAKKPAVKKVAAKPAAKPVAVAQKVVPAVTPADVLKNIAGTNP